MNLFLYLTNFIVPFLILAIIVYGLLMKINVYEHFIKGARNGFLTVLKSCPHSSDLWWQWVFSALPGFWR